MKKKRIRLIIEIWCMAVILFAGSIRTAKTEAVAAESIETELSADKSSYEAGEKADICFSLKNYNEAFQGEITTMIVELSYDETKMSPDITTMKKIADDNGGMGFSHIAAESEGTVLYQYVNVEEPLKQGSSEIFSMQFDVKETVVSIEEAVQVSKIIMQDGRQAESVRFPVNTSVNVDTKVQETVNDKTVGIQVYNREGGLLTEEEQKAIQQEAQGNNTAAEGQPNRAAGESTDTNVNADTNETAAAEENTTQKTDSGIPSGIWIVVIIAAVAAAFITVILKKHRLLQRKEKHENDES